LLVASELVLLFGGMEKIKVFGTKTNADLGT
jgi:hypothetical protein